jgi:hypothetical protein
MAVRHHHRSKTIVRHPVVLKREVFLVHATKVVGARLQLYVFLSSALDGDGQLHAPAVPPPENDHPVPIE